MLLPYPWHSKEGAFLNGGTLHQFFTRGDLCYPVFPHDVDHGNGMGHGLNPVSVDFVELVEVADDLVELVGKLRAFILGQAEPGQSCNVFYVFDRDHVSFFNASLIQAVGITFWYSRRKTGRCEHLILELVILFGTLLLTLTLIVASSELFTNGIEWLGQRLHLSEGVVGSVLAAVGTALPETLIPIVALVFFGQEHGAEVGVGAITGAPFMLSSLTLGLCGLTCILCTRSGRREPGLRVKGAVIKRDLKFFIVAYGLALAASFLPGDPEMKIWRYLMAVGLLLIYPYYLYKSFRHEGEVGEEPEQLYISRALSPVFDFGSLKLRLIIPQVVFGLIGITVGAYIFVHYIQLLAGHLHVPPLLLSLIVSPIATEAPEKINSIIWLRKRKDTLAIGNVTGALVFQSCFPVAFGVAFTAWTLDLGTLMTGIVALLSATTYWLLLKYEKLKPQHLVCGMLVYVGTIAAIIGLELHNKSTL